MLAETICSAVSAAGLGIAALTAYRKRFLAATRIAAYALVPLGLVMTGVVDWLAGIVFKPTVWIGFGVLGLAWLLFMTTRAIERRGRPAADPAVEAAPRTRSRKPTTPAAVAPAASTPAATPRPAPATPADDFSDIEAILKKHGI
ncbi:hypothetical protein [Streptomyces sp. NPDC089919]|uniref:hypothetical protein n=1 Tax=Streptomyces sp. NPDC089919 TaxID=3155188 RepID=UPI003425F043